MDFVGGKARQYTEVFMANRWLVLSLLALFAIPSAGAQTTTPTYPVNMSPPEAAKLSSDKKILLIDIRRPEEWSETGVAEHAHKLDMTDELFLAKLSKVTEGNRTRPIALICRTASRTRVVQSALMQMGYSSVINVEGGMIGNDEDKGWIKHGLPLAKAE
jgi:rhodanese-related sulfurtransferase